MKNIGKPCAGEPHARFDEGGQAKACSLLYPLAYHQLPAAYYLAARFPDDFEAAVLHAVNGGGQNQARAILTGALAGAQTGLSGIPQRFLDGLEDGATLTKLAADLAEQAGAEPATAA